MVASLLGGRRPHRNTALLAVSLVSLCTSQVTSRRKYSRNRWTVESRATGDNMAVAQVSLGPMLLVCGRSQIQHKFKSSNAQCCQLSCALYWCCLGLAAGLSKTALWLHAACAFQSVPSAQLEVCSPYHAPHWGWCVAALTYTCAHQLRARILPGAPLLVPGALEGVIVSMLRPHVSEGACGAV